MPRQVNLVEGSKVERSRIAIILDKSGSMRTGKEATIEGFNTFIEEQKKLSGECSVRLVQFSTEVEVTYDKPLSTVEDLTDETYQPDGGTALLDAIGDTVSALDLAIAETSLEKRPKSVVVVIITDGQENASRHYTQKFIADLIKTRQAQDWTFVFLGADQDAMFSAKELSINTAYAMSYKKSTKGVRNMYASTAVSVNMVRSGLKSFAAFDDEDKTAALED